MGTEVEVAAVLGVLHACPRLELASVSDLLPTRGTGPIRWVRAYANAIVRPQTAPCHGPAAATWVGEAVGPDGPVHLWTCRGCGQTWTTPVRTVEVPR